MKYQVQLDTTYDYSFYLFFGTLLTTLFKQGEKGKGFESFGTRNTSKTPIEDLKQSKLLFELFYGGFYSKEEKLKNWLNTEGLFGDSRVRVIPCWHTPTRSQCE